MQLNMLVLERKVYNNDDITFFAVRAVTHYHTRAWQTLIYESLALTHRTTGCFDDRLLTMMTDTGFYVP